MDKPRPRTLRDGYPVPADFRRCFCTTRAGKPCPIEADRTWEGMPVCHVHDPDGAACAKNPTAKEIAHEALIQHKLNERKGAA